VADIVAAVKGSNQFLLIKSSSIVELTASEKAAIINNLKSARYGLPGERNVHR